MNDISHYIDHTNLRQDALESEMIVLCEEAINFGFASVCVNPVHVQMVNSILKHEGPKTCTVIGFPLGADSSEMKFAEARFLVHQGAEELDMVLNVGALKQGELQVIENEIGQVVDAADGNCVKVIIETCLLTREEKIVASKIARSVGANFVKTSTGFSSGGATVEDVKLIRKTVGEGMGVKASGGIRTLDQLRSMVSAGADRIGTSSGVEMVS
ncbi:MAG: deoxyribose-phosphate aldolase [Candidatus Marinimicrobia bacterium]|nr:deoxyribose-phosphate aldolase [Candidatus Neomarinimicrobiota bacterium]|tara:strand:+ start:1042 stop:1683 length:642 start_codon:yes stop_codon:yes gene_type:complete